MQSPCQTEGSWEWKTGEEMSGERVGGVMHLPPLQHSLKGFELGGLEVASIQDVTPVAHNGCKPKKKRRI